MGRTLRVWLGRPTSGCCLVHAYSVPCSLYNSPEDASLQISSWFQVGKHRANLQVSVPQDGHVDTLLKKSREAKERAVLAFLTAYNLDFLFLLDTGTSWGHQN